MATLTQLIARVKRSLDLVGVGSRVTDSNIIDQLNASMLTIARRVKLPKLSVSALVYTNSQTAVHAGTGAATDMAVDWNPTAGADAKAIIVTVQTNKTTFKYSINGGADSAAVTITGLSQTIYKKISVTFSATTATAGDTWTWTAYADLPSDYHRGLVSAERTVTADSPIRILASYQELRERHQRMNDSGTPCEGAIGEQKQLFIQPLPSATEAIQVFYQRKPVDMPNISPSTEEPDGLDADYHFPLLCNHAAGDILDDLGQLEQANNKLRKAEMEMNALMVEEGVTDELAEEIRDENMYTE